MKILKSREGNSILGYIFIYPTLILFIMYLVLGGAYFMDQNNMLTISNLSLDRALVEGKYTDEIYTELNDKLSQKGFTDSLTIEITPSAATHTNVTDYVKRGDIITLKVVYAKPHPFYHINRIFVPALTEERFYTTVTLYGMSEKW